MSKELTSQEARELLPAFVDGELDEAQKLRVLEAMAADPSCTRRVLVQQQLRQACGRVLTSPSLRCPADLRQRIQAMAGDLQSDESLPKPSVAPLGQSDRGPVLARIGRWALPLAVAAALGLAVLVTLNFSASRAERLAEAGLYTADGLVTARLARQLSERHVQCAHGDDPLTPEGLAPIQPGDLVGLDAALVDHFDAELQNASLDLSSIGYDYQIAGLCPVPGDGAVHVIYENPDGRRLSLWIKPYDGQPMLDPGVPYVPPAAHAEHPMVVWRQANTVFYLVGETREEVQQARPAIRLASAV